MRLSALFLLACLVLCPAWGLAGQDYPQPGQNKITQPVVVRDQYGHYMGTLRYEGPPGNANIYDARNHFQGHIKDGFIYDKHGRYLGKTSQYNQSGQLQPDGAKP